MNTRNNNNMQSIRINLKKVSAVIGICVGVITISSAIVSGLGFYYGIPEIKSSVKELEKEQKTIGKDVSEIKGLVKKYYTGDYYRYENNTTNYIVYTNFNPRTFVN